MTKIRMPGDIQVPTKFFGFLTPKDLIRLGTPSLIVVFQSYGSPSLATLGWLFIAAIIGIVWSAWKPYGRPLDNHLYNAVRWKAVEQLSETSEVESIDEGVVESDDGSAVAVVEVQPTNLEMKTQAEQRAVHNIYRELIHAVTYPLEVHSRQEQLELTEYVEHLRQRDSDGALREDYIDYCADLAEREFTTTKHYIVLRVEEPSPPITELLPVEEVEWLPIDFEEEDQGFAVRKELENRASKVLSKFNTADLTADLVVEDELERIVADLDDPEQETWDWTAHPEEEGEYRRTASIAEYPSNVELGWPRELLRTDGLVDVVQVIRPRNSGKTSRKLQRLSEKLNAEIDSFLSQGYRGTNKLEALLDDVEWILDLLADREDQPVDYSTYITVHHPDKETCQQAFEQLCNRLQTLQIDYQQPVFRTDQAYQTQSLFHTDRLDQRLLVPAASAAAGLPFVTQSIEEAKGVIYGIDTSDRTPILLDRFSWPSHSTARMGMVGSGKSYATKLEILRSYLVYDDLQIIVVDPKKEYKHLVDSLGGTTHTLHSGIKIGSKLQEDVVSFEVKERGKQENADRLAELVEELYNQVSQNRRKTLVVIDEARILMNHDHGRDVLNQFVLEGRDTNTAITLVTQNASHFTHCREGREILDNMPGKVFMRHDRVPEDVVDYFDLSQREKQELFELKTGTDADHSEGLVKISGNLDTRVRVEATDAEHELIEKRRVEL